MAKKIKRPPEVATPGASAPRQIIAPPTAHPRRRWLRSLVVAALVAALGLGAARTWQWVRLPARVLAALPAPPDLTGKPALQIEVFAKATALARSSGHALEGAIELGRLYHANGYRAEAEACWRLLRRLQPREARWNYYLADLRRAASDYDEVTALLNQTVALNPDYSPAWLQLAGLEFKSGQLDLAARHYQRRLDLVPGDFYATLGLARLAQQNGHTDEYRRQIEKIVHDFAEISTGHNLYAEILLAAGDTDGARKQRWFGRETGRFKEPEDPWLDALQAWCYDFGRLTVLATIEEQTQRGDKGKSLIERALRLEPDNPIGYEILGGMQRKLGKLPESRDTFEEGLRRAKTSKPTPLYYVNLSETYRLLKQPADALRVVQLGFTQVGDHLELFDALGVALADLNRQEEAVAAFREALARSPNDSNSNYNLGMSLLTLGRQDEAKAAFQRSLVLQPTFMKALSLLGRWELETGQLLAAGGYLQPLYESHPELPEARQMFARWHQLSGQVAEKKGDLAVAEKHYRASVVLDGGRAELQSGLGVFFLMQGRVNDALAPLETFHKLAPADPQSSLFLGQVYLQLGRFGEAKRILTEGEQLATRAGSATTAAHFREILQSL